MNRAEFHALLGLSPEDWLKLDVMDGEPQEHEFTRAEAHAILNAETDTVSVALEEITANEADDEEAERG